MHARSERMLQLWLANCGPQPARGSHAILGNLAISPADPGLVCWR